MTKQFLTIPPAEWTRENLFWFLVKKNKKIAEFIEAEAEAITTKAANLPGIDLFYVGISLKHKESGKEIFIYNKQQGGN